MGNDTDQDLNLWPDLLTALVVAIFAIIFSVLVLLWFDQKPQEWQTLLAAVFGGFGLGLAHFLTSNHQRRQEAQQRTNETKAIATALRVEFAFLSTFIGKHVNAIRKAWPEIDEKECDLSEAGKIEVSLVRAVVFEAFVDRLDKLPHEIIIDVVGLNLILRTFNKSVETGYISKVDIENLEKVVELSPQALVELDKIIKE